MVIRMPSRVKRSSDQKSTRSNRRDEALTLLEDALVVAGEDFALRFWNWR